MSTDEIKDEKPHEIKGDKNPRPLNEDDIAHLKTCGLRPYSTSITIDEKNVKDMAKRINDLCASKESNTATPSRWDLVFDKQMMQRLVPDVPLPPPRAPGEIMSGITRVLPSRTVSPTRNGVHHPVPAVPGSLRLRPVRPRDLCRDEELDDEEFGCFDEYEIQTQPNSPENFRFSDFEEILRNAAAVEEGLTNPAAVKEGIDKTCCCQRRN